MLRAGRALDGEYRGFDEARPRLRGLRRSGLARALVVVVVVGNAEVGEADVVLGVRVAIVGPVGLVRRLKARPPEVNNMADDRSHFCMDLAEALASYADLAWHRELPDGQGPQFDTLDAAPGDVVLAVNLFGRGHREPWDAWSCEHPLVTVIEDHTHDPLSSWARASTASSCMASLRKTPRARRRDPVVCARRDTSHGRWQREHGRWLKLSAMTLKAACLSGKDVCKSEFRSLQKTGEAVSLVSTTELTALTRLVLPLLDVWQLRPLRADNVRVRNGRCRGTSSARGTLSPTALQVLFLSTSSFCADLKLLGIRCWRT